MISSHIDILLCYNVKNKDYIKAADGSQPFFFLMTGYAGLFLCSEFVEKCCIG